MKLAMLALAASVVKDRAAFRAKLAYERTPEGRVERIERERPAAVKHMTFALAKAERTREALDFLTHAYGPHQLGAPRLCTLGGVECKLCSVGLWRQLNAKHLQQLVQLNAMDRRLRILPDSPTMGPL